MNVRCFLIASLILQCFVGCRAIGTGDSVINSPAYVAEGYSLERAVMAAANRRRWSVEKLSENTFRLTIHQRTNLCSVKVTTGDGCFSITPIASNITIAKYNQWVRILEREIRHRANLGQ